MGRKSQASERDTIDALSFAFCAFKNDDGNPFMEPGEGPGRRPSRRKSKKRREKDKEKIASAYLDENESLGEPETFQHPNPFMVDDERKEEPADVERGLRRSSSSSSVSSLGSTDETAGASRVAPRAAAVLTVACLAAVAVCRAVAASPFPAATATTEAWTSPRAFDEDVVGVGGAAKATQWRSTGWDGEAYASEEGAALPLAPCATLARLECLGAFSLAGAHGDDPFLWVEIDAEGAAGVLELGLYERRATGDDTARRFRYAYGALRALVTNEVALSLADASKDAAPWLPWKRKSRQPRALRYADQHARFEAPEADRAARVILRSSGFVVEERARTAAYAALADLGGAFAALVLAASALLAAARLASAVARAADATLRRAARPAVAAS